MISQTADLETNIQSAYYYEAGTSVNALECHIISAGLWLRLFTDQSVLHQTAAGIISPLEFVNKASHFQNKFWENHDLT